MKFLAKIFIYKSIYQGRIYDCTPCFNVIYMENGMFNDLAI